MYTTINIKNILLRLSIIIISFVHTNYTYIINLYWLPYTTYNVSYTNISITDLIPTTFDLNFL